MCRGVSQMEQLMKDVNYLYCNHPLYQNRVDFGYEEEYEVAKKDNSCALFSYEDMENGKLRLFGDAIQGLTIYRGWMMKPDMYRAFYNELQSFGIELINSPDDYNKYHMLPGWYTYFKDCTAKSRWTEDLTEESIRQLLFGFDGAVIVKGYVKSRKHEWYQSCFIPDANDTKNAMRTILNFIEKQSDSLTGGLVLREFLDLISIGEHADSGMPLSEEYRVFVLDNQPIAIESYWHRSSNCISNGEIAWIKEISERITSRFVTIDLARKIDGELVIMELGDGQVSGLQEIAPIELYNNINISLQ